eukprot:16652_1
MTDLEVNMTQTYLRSIYQIICNNQKHKELNIKLLINDLAAIKGAQTINYKDILKQYFDELLPPHVHRIRMRNKSKKRRKKVKTMGDMNSYCGSALFAAKKKKRRRKKKKKKSTLSMTRFNSMSLLSMSSILNKTNCSVIVINALRRELHGVDDNQDGKVDCAEFMEALSTLKSRVSDSKAAELFGNISGNDHELSINTLMDEVEMMYIKYPTITGDECIEKVSLKHKPMDMAMDHYHMRSVSNYSVLSLQSMQSLPCMDEMKDTDDNSTHTVKEIEEIVNLCEKYRTCMFTPAGSCDRNYGFCV